MFWFKTRFSQDFDRPCQLQIPTDLRPIRMWPPFETLSELLSEGEGEGRRDFVPGWEEELGLSSSAPSQGSNCPQSPCPGARLSSGRSTLIFRWLSRT